MYRVLFVCLFYLNDLAAFETATTTLARLMAAIEKSPIIFSEEKIEDLFCKTASVSQPEEVAILQERSSPPNSLEYSRKHTLLLAQEMPLRLGPA